jgi:protein SCO1
VSKLTLLNALKILRLGAWASVAFALFVASAIVIGWWRSEGTSRFAALTPIAGIGGPFTLVDQHGKVVTEKDFLGKPFLVFFGFTHCPEVCPTTLLDLTQRLQALGSDADKLNVLFITVDPERDTPEQLNLYLSSFDPRITGLSGTPEQVDTAAKAYKAYYRKVPTEDGGYTMDHLATVYMMNAQGSLAGIITYQEAESAAVAKLKRLVTSTS